MRGSVCFMYVFSRCLGSLFRICGVRVLDLHSASYMFYYVLGPPAIGARPLTPFLVGSFGSY